MHFAAANGYVESIRILYKLGVDINVQDKLGSTSLHYAAAKNQVESIGVLHELDIDLDQKYQFI